MATKTKKTTAANRLNGDGDLSTLKETKESERLKITIAEFETQIIRIKIVGDSPLIVNRFKDKTIKQLADKHAGVARRRARKEGRPGGLPGVALHAPRWRLWISLFRVQQCGGFGLHVAGQIGDHPHPGAAGVPGHGRHGQD